MNGVIHTVAWGDCMYERLYERQQQFEMVNETCVYEKRISIVDWFSTLGVFPQTSIEIKAHNIDKRKSPQSRVQWLGLYLRTQVSANQSFNTVPTSGLISSPLSVKLQE